MAKLTPTDIEYLFPVTSVTVHLGGHLTVNRSPRFPPPREIIGNKKSITKLSTKSLRRLNHIMQTTLIQFNSILTLTYGKYYPRDGELVKSDLQYILRVCRIYSDNYLWFLEFQARGAPHVHILLETANITPRMRVKIATSWVTRILEQEYFWSNCPVGSVNAETIKMLSVAAHHKSWETIREPDGAKRYVAKYATKTYQKVVPDDYKNVGRFWGATRPVKEVLGVTLDCTLEELQSLLEKHSHKVSKWDVMPKYIWGLNGDT